MTRPSYFQELLPMSLIHGCSISHPCAWTRTCHGLSQDHGKYVKTLNSPMHTLTCTPSCWLHPCIHMGKRRIHVYYIIIINILKPHEVYGQWGPRLVVEGMPSLAWYVCMPSLTSKAGMAGPHPPPPYPINEGHHRVGGAQLCMPIWVAWGGDEGMSLPCVCVCMYVCVCMQSGWGFPWAN